MEKILLDATIGRALEALLGAVLQARERAHMYESILAQLEFTIHTITPKISEIDRLSDKDFPDDVIHRIRLQLIRGKELVDKCSNAGGCDFCKGQRYYKKLLELDESLRRLITIDLQVKVALDVVRISNEMKAICRRWDQMDVNGGGGRGWIFNLSRSRVLGNKFSGLKRFVQSVKSAPKRILINLVTCGAITGQ
ncbi:RPW8-like protein 1 [Pyrus communis]|uniref:RPW8-like protein 1 n=1 Tax=Pyrus communis TaxID=23211 RepID=UPI0035C02391